MASRYKLLNGDNYFLFQGRRVVAGSDGWIRPDSTAMELAIIEAGAVPAGAVAAENANGKPLVSTVVKNTASQEVYPVSSETMTANQEALSLTFARYFPGDAARSNLSQGLVDCSGNGGTTSLGSAQTAAAIWANAGYFSTTAGANKHIATDFTFNFDSDLVIIAGQIKAAAFGGLTFIAGNSQAIASTPDNGLAIGSSVAGQLLLYIQSASAGTTTQTINTGVICDGADHDMVIVLDPRQRSIYAWIDGVLLFTKSNAYPAGLGACARSWVFGAHSNVGTSVACQFKNFNLVKVTGGAMPVNMNAVAAEFHTTPGDITRLFDKTTKSIGLFVAGQSNETGQGVSAATNTGVGTPIKDPTFPNGQANKRSFYPSMAATLGAAGYKLDVHNHAVGGTGLRDSWVGYLANWVNAGLVKRGSWRVSNGGLWKCAVVGQTSTPASTVAPSGTADTTGADSIPWTYMGPFTGQYEYGVQSQASALYDPNGNIAALTAAMATYQGPRKIVMCQFGQTDANQAISRAEFNAALQVFAKHMVSVGATRVMLGLSIYAEQAWKGNYDTALVPGLTDALAALTPAYPSVVLGVNLYTAMGVLPVTPASGIGLQVDGLHGIDATFDLGGAMIGARVLAIL